jgi:hypothetical protein
MIKRISIALGILLVAMMGIWLVVRRGSGATEPVYQGKTLTLWLEDHFTTLPNSPGREKADEAVRRIGTNAIPSLLRMIRAKDPPAFVLKLLDLAGKQRLVRIRYRHARQRHYGADYAFQILGTNAVCAVPELIRICEAPRDPASQEYAAKALGDIGPAAKAAIPVLLRSFAHTNAEVRFRAVSAVLQIGGDPNILVPALKSVLKDPKREVRFNAVGALRRLGARARPALPELMEALQDPYIKNEVENILWNLVPEKIAKPLVVEESTPMVSGGVTTEALSRVFDGKLWTLIPQGKPVRCVAYQSVGDQPLDLYRGLTQTSAKDHFLGHFEVVGLPSPSTNLNIEVVYIIDNQQVLLCARDYTRKQFLELRRVQNEAAK